MTLKASKYAQSRLTMHKHKRGMKKSVQDYSTYQSMNSLSKGTESYLTNLLHILTVSSKL